MSLLQQLIGDLSQEGFVESQGRFSLDVEAARRRLADFTLADPYQWVLKMVQAATLLDCKDIAVSTSGNELGLRFEGLTVSLEEFECALHALTLEDRSNARQLGLNHLAQALHALQRRAGPQLVLRAAQPGNSYALEGGSLLTRPTDTTWRAEPMLTLVLQRGWNWMQREWPEVELLRRRAYAAPCRFSSNLQFWSKSLLPMQQSTGFFSAWRNYGYSLQLLVNPGLRGRAPMRDRPHVDSPGSGVNLFCCDALLKKFAAVRGWDFNGEVEAALSCWSGANRRGRLSVWLDGVLSEPVDLAELPCDAVIGRQGLTCDLSGLRLVLNDALRERVDWVRQAYEKLLRVQTRVRSGRTAE